MSAKPTGENLVNKYYVKYTATICVIADGGTEARKIADNELAHIHPKWKMQWKSMSISALDDESPTKSKWKSVGIYPLEEE